MRRLLLFSVGIAALSLVVAGQASAKAIDWAGTMVLELGPLPPLVTNGSGVATVNSSSGSNHLSTLRLAGGISGTDIAPVTDPEVTGTIPSVRVTATLGTGTISGIVANTNPVLGQVAGNRTLPVLGLARVCIAVAGCAAALPLQLSQNNGNSGIGVGGLLTIGNKGNIRISIEATGWTIGTGMGISQTPNAGFTNRTRTGFVHDANSGTSSTAANSGIIQLISPMQVITDGVPGENEKLQLFGTLTIHFIPEPGVLLLLGSGVVGLVLIGRHRMRK